jgi:HemY protein
MVKVGVVVGLALWIAERPGTVRIEWLEYAVNVHVGLFLLALLVVIQLSIFIYNIIRTFTDFPKSYRRYLEIRRLEKGHKALTLGLTAVAAGDTKNAVYQAHRAREFLPKDESLPLLLEAQAARLDGREEDARKSFTKLIESKDAGFLGVRGLLQAALDSRNYPKALEIGRQALKFHPKQPWILRVVYDLEIRARDWASAEKTLYRAEKVGAFTSQKANSDRVAMLLLQADVDLQAAKGDAAFRKIFKAVKFDPKSVPAAVRLAKIYNMNGKRKKALAVIERAWKENPHPELIAMWDALAPQGKAKKKISRMQWFEKLLKDDVNSAEAQFALGRVAFEEGLWGDARNYLMRAQEIAPSASIYKALADLEERATRSDEAVVTWLEKAADAPPDKTWMCMETGRMYDRWYPIAPPHGAFNSIVWDLPDSGFTSAGLIAARADDTADVFRA